MLEAISAADLASAFVTPQWLWLLLALPVVVLARHRSEAALSRERRLLGATLRVAAFAALIVALAGPLSGTTSRFTSVVAAIDVSNSVSRAERERARLFVAQLIEAKAPQQEVGVVVFGADAAVETSLSANTAPLQELSVDVNRDGSDIQQALELAMSRFSSGGSRRILLLSDGMQTAGSAQLAAVSAAAVDVQVDVMPMTVATGTDVGLQNLKAPSHVAALEPFTLALTVSADQATRAALALLRNGQLTYETELDLRAGKTRINLADTVARAGLFEYEAVINALDDTVPENNRYQAFVKVRGAPSVAYVSRSASGPAPFAAALGAQGFDVSRLTPGTLPATLHGLTDYSLVILDNISGYELSLARLELLERYVRLAGGGVVTVGGDRSYSAGGYQDTPLEQLLPVTMEIPAEVKIPSLVVTVLIDRSGSMSATASGEEKLTIAKNAAFAAIEVLNPLDRLGVLAFDSDAEWIVPPTQAGHRRAIAQRLRQLRAGGGTNLLNAMQEAYKVMDAQAAKLKHVIILSDGLSDDEERFGSEFDVVARQFADAKITVSTVAFGHDANQPLMARIARLGEGRFYFTEDPRNVPRIFTSETVVVSRGLIVERTAEPRIKRANELLAGFSPQDFPPLAGYLRVHTKPAAQPVLVGPDDDPLLAVWQYGLGRSAAFTSDLQGQWSSQWLAWNRFSQLAAQLARWTMRRQPEFGLTPSVQWSDTGEGTFTVDAFDRNDSFVNGLTMDATLTGPRNLQAATRLEQTAPGRYETRFNAAGSGRYYISLSASAQSANTASTGEQDASVPVVAPQTFGAALPYSAEYRQRGGDLNTLQSIARTTNGRVLPQTTESVAKTLAAVPGEHWHKGRVWWPWVSAALILLLLEIAVRRVRLPERWQKLRSGADTVPSEASPEYHELMAKLARQREAHLDSLADRYAYVDDDPVSRARLYTGAPGNRQ